MSKKQQKPMSQQNDPHKIKFNKFKPSNLRFSLIAKRKDSKSTMKMYTVSYEKNGTSKKMLLQVPDSKLEYRGRTLAHPESLDVNSIQYPIDAEASTDAKTYLDVLSSLDKYLESQKETLLGSDDKGQVYKSCIIKSGEGDDRPPYQKLKFKVKNDMLDLNNFRIYEVTEDNPNPGLKRDDITTMEELRAFVPYNSVIKIIFPLFFL